MGNLRLLLVVAVLCAGISDASAQNRGSVRYSAEVADDDYDGEITRAQRPAPTRRSSARRQKPTPSPEPSEAVEELSAFQIPSRRTTGRRVPSRVSSEHFDPPPPVAPLAPEEPPLPAVVDELPQITTAAPGEKSQGRRRRPKKRRRPQNGSAKPGSEAEKQRVNDPEKIKVPAVELLNTDQKPPQSFLNNPELINNPNTYDSSTGLIDKAVWSNDKLENTAAGQRNSEPTQYYPPQAGTNRLPMEDTERIESSRGYSEPPLPVLNRDIPNRRYVPPKPADEQPSRASYVPVLSPIRVPSEGLSRLPHDEYSDSRNKESPRQVRPSDRRGPQRTSGNIVQPVQVSSSEVEGSRSRGTKPPQNFIPHGSQPSIPERGLPEVRLPPTEQPFIDNEFDKNFNDQPGYETSEELLGRLHDEENPVVDSIDHQVPNVANRLPNPPEGHYDSTYPSYDENLASGERAHSTVPQRRQETTPHTSRAVYNDVQPQESPQRTQSSNNVDTGRRQISRYQPPLQRSGSRYSSEGSDQPVGTRNTASESQLTETPTRGRGSSRYQPESEAGEFSRTRSSSRSSSESSVREPARTRSPQTQAPSQVPSRSRNTQRYQPDPAESTSRLSARRQPVDSEYVGAVSRPEEQTYRQRAPAPVNEEGHEYISHPPHHSPENVPEVELQDDSLKSTLRNRPPHHSHANVPEEELQDHSLRSTLRNRPPHHSPGNVPEELQDHSLRSTVRNRPPQYPVRDTAEPYAYEDPSDGRQDQNTYVPEYQPPRQQGRREPVNQRPPPPREQPDRQVSRQSSRRENSEHRNAPRQQQPDYRAPQDDTRYQPQYQAPQNDRSQVRQQAARQQPRPRHPEPSSNQGHSSGSSKFKCPEPYGFFSDPVQCDKYYECRNGTAVESLCEDGLAFNANSAPKFLRCDSLRDVDCSSRPELQDPKPTANCPRRYGLYPHETDCTRFWNCVDGAATEVKCPPGLTFNDDRATCDWADLVKTSCKTEDLLGFTCPEPNDYDLQDGVYTSYPHPDNCQLHFICIKGEDGARRPRMLSCNEGLVYNPTAKSCTRPDDVAGCEDFYGSLSPRPKQRKPTREPIEPEEYEEEPTPKPRRRVVQHRRVRN